MKIKFYKNNRTDRSFVLTPEQYVEQFIAYRNHDNPGIKGMPFERQTGIFNTYGLNAVPENVPFTDDEFNAIWKEYKSRRNA